MPKKIQLFLEIVNIHVIELWFEFEEMRIYSWPRQTMNYCIFYLRIQKEIYLFSENIHGLKNECSLQNFFVFKAFVSVRFRIQMYYMSIAIFFEITHAYWIMMSTTWKAWKLMSKKAKTLISNYSVDLFQIKISMCTCAFCLRGLYGTAPHHQKFH